MQLKGKNAFFFSLTSLEIFLHIYALYNNEFSKYLAITYTKSALEENT